MKKIIYLIILLFPITVSAFSYDIENLFIDANILEDGSMEVKELVVLNGSFQEFNKNITYRNSHLKQHEPINFTEDAIYNGSKMEFLGVSAKKIENQATFDTIEEDFEPLNKAFYKEDAKNLEYVESSIQDGKNYQIFYRASYETVAFLFSYKIEDVVVSHLDVAELYWPFVAENYDSVIESLEIHLTLPKEEPSDFFQAWVHGDLTSTIQKMNQKTVVLTARNVRPKTKTEMRVTFDVNLTPLSKKTTTEEAFSKIIEIEENRTQKEIETKSRTDLLTQVISMICFFYSVTLIIWWIFVYFKYDKEPKIKTPKYNKDFIENYNVEVVEPLLNGNITHHAFVASILNLINKKNITVKKIANTKKDIYEFELKTKDYLNDTEDVLINFLFDKIGDGKTFTSLDLKQYGMNKMNHPKFIRNYENWMQCVKKDVDRQNFYEQNGLPIITGIFLLLIAFFIAFMVIYFDLPMFYHYLVLGLGIIFFFYVAMIKKRTEKGRKDSAKWLAMKQYLLDFERLNPKELPESKDWIKYYLYSIVLDIKEETFHSMLKQSKNKIQKNKLIKLNHLTEELDSILQKSLEKGEKEK